jgi:hypothetical protein
MDSEPRTERTRGGEVKVDKRGRATLRVRIDPDQLERLQKVADERVVGVDLLIKKAIDIYLQALPPFEGEAKATVVPPAEKRPVKDAPQA